MGDLLGILIPLGFVTFFLAIGFFVGGTVERRHLASLARREESTKQILVSQVKTFPLALSASDPAPTMLCAEVVISSDYLKTILGAIRGILGGELHSFQGIIERSRREGIARLREQAQQAGYDAICNVRVETADIAGRGQNNKNKMFMSAVMVTGTAYRTGRDAPPGQA